MNNKNFAVGVFVAFALVVFIAATLWLTGNRGTETTAEYSMFFEKDVSGLMLGGPVFYLGVNVGTVTAMEIVPGNPMRVRVDAEVLGSAPIDAGTFASLAFQGITGVAVIKLSADPGEYGPLPASADSEFPVIPVRATGFSAVLEKAPEIVGKLDRILVQINQIMGEENRQFVSTMLEDFAKVTNALAEQEEAIGDIPVMLVDAIEDLRGGLAEVRSMLRNLDPGLSTTVDNLAQATQNLTGLTERLEALMAGNEDELNAFVQGGLGQVPDFISDARVTLREVEKLVKDLRADPSTIIYKPIDDTVVVEQ